MSQIAISDANIFIDLLRLGFVSPLFEIGLEVVTSQEVFDELIEEQKEALQPFIAEGKLKVHAFSPAAFVELKTFHINNRLPFSDHSVVFLAEKIAAIVLTGDQLILKACEQRNIEVHGILWLLDRFLEYGFLDKMTAHALLTRLIQFNQWLPREACLKKLREWE